MCEDSRESISEADRRKLLSKIRSSLFWVGRMIPETEVIEGEKVDLRGAVYNYIASDCPTEEEIQGAMSLAMLLQCKVDDMEDRMRHDDITREEADELLDHILGLKRAIDELKRRSGPASEVRLQMMMHKVDDQRRWLDFIRSVK